MDDGSRSARSAAGDSSQSLGPFCQAQSNAGSCGRAPYQTLLTTPNKPHSDEARLMFTNKDMSSLLKYIYCTKKKEQRTRNGGVHSSKRSVDGMHAGQSRSSKSIPLYWRFQRKGLCQQQQDWWGKVMLDCIQPRAGVPGAAAYQAVPTPEPCPSLQLLTQSPRTAGWHSVYLCPSNIHGKSGLRKRGLRVPPEGVMAPVMTRAPRAGGRVKHQRA